MRPLKDYWEICKDTFKDWNARNISSDAASLAYYAIFSVPGLLIIVIWVAGIFFGQEAVRGQITTYIGSMMGKDVGSSVQEMILSGMVDKKNVYMKIFGIGTLVFGATTLFFQLQRFLNKLWDVEAAPKKAWQKYILDRANSLGLILVFAFLLLITLLLSSVIGLANSWIVHRFDIETYFIIQFLNIVVGLFFTMLLFAFMFKVLPDVEIEWKSVWVGAFVTSVLFALGKFLLTYYFNTFKPTSAFGAAGTIILIMMWVNYTCQLIFLGADFTKVYAKKMGHTITPSRHARPAPQIVPENPKSENVVFGAEHPETAANSDKKTPKDSII